MEWNECLNDWGTRLRGLAQGGLHYGGDGETGFGRGISSEFHYL